MISVTIQEDEPLGRFIEARAAQLGRPPDEVADEIVREGWLRLVQTLHEQFLRGEFSQGHMAESLGIGRRDLIHLLEVMNLPVTNL